MDARLDCAGSGKDGNDLDSPASTPRGTKKKGRAKTKAKVGGKGASASPLAQETAPQISAVIDMTVALLDKVKP